MPCTRWAGVVHGTCLRVCSLGACSRGCQSVYNFTLEVARRKGRRLARLLYRFVCQYAILLGVLGCLWPDQGEGKGRGSEDRHSGLQEQLHSKRKQPLLVQDRVASLRWATQEAGGR
eukprot:422884-Rhodomonas_salina.1